MLVLVIIIGSAALIGVACVSLGWIIAQCLNWYDSRRTVRRVRVFRTIRPGQ